MTPTSYRQILCDAFHARKARRPSYSLRAFARDIGLSAPQLNSILAKRKGLSVGRAVEVAEKLALPGKQQKMFCDLVESEHARSKNDRELARQRLDLAQGEVKWEPASSDDQKLALRWYYPAILELISVKSGKIDADLCAAALCLSRDEAESALEFMQRNGLISKIENIFARTKDYVQLLSAQPNTEIRKFHGQISELFVDRIEASTPDTRKVVSAVISFKKSRVAEAKKFIEDSRQQFIERFAQDTDSDAVYILSQNFFRADKET